MKRSIVLLVACLFISANSQAENTSEIKQVNTLVAGIEKSKDSLYVMEISLQIGELEASPPELKYYFKPGSNEPAILQVSVGHETFVTRHSYYFNHARVIKYIKETVGRPDSPPKEAVIYGGDGQVLWKNRAEPVVDAKQAGELFEAAMSAIKAFARY